MVTRFDCWDLYCVDEDPDGAFVHYDAYAEVEAERDSLKSALAAAQARVEALTRGLSNLSHRADLVLTTYVCVDHGNAPCSDREYLRTRLDEARALLSPPAPDAQREEREPLTDITGCDV